MTDFDILHRRCGHLSEGWVQDGMYAQDACNICDQEFGFNVPITVDEGRLRAHLSCVVEEEMGT